MQSLSTYPHADEYPGVSVARLGGFLTNQATSSGGEKMHWAGGQNLGWFCPHLAGFLIFNYIFNLFD